MNELLHADIFFFITGIAVVFIAVVLFIALVYVIRILNDVKSVSSDIKQVSEKAKEEADRVLDDVATFRGNIKKEGLRLKHLTNFFSNRRDKQKGRK
ncbi:MAG: hypothetical protein HYW88_01420 [Candidatus Sungbacteria bacterium]|nr:hypothetical protein [Candidatus Sungbacteria bacterium]